MTLPAFPTSLPGFQQTFADEGSCLAYMEAIRWHEGFTCPACNVKGEPQRISTRPRVLRCAACKVETSITAGTVMHDSHTPLCTWFWGAYLVTTQTPGMSALQFQRQVGLRRYETAFQILHKLRAAMVRPDRDMLGVKYPVEVDEALVGGRTRGEGRGVHHKTIVVGAVEVRRAEDKELSDGTVRAGKKYAGRLRLCAVPDRQGETLTQFVDQNIVREAHVITDGWQGYNALESMHYEHESVVLKGDPDMTERHLPLIHIVFSNLKTWLLGTHHGVSSKHLQAYLNEYVFRFNRRFYPFNAFNSILGIGAKTASPTYRQLYAGEWAHPTQGCCETGECEVAP